MATKEAVPLSVMLGNGQQLKVGDRLYTVFPLKLKDVDAFVKDTVNLGSQLFSLLDEDRKKVLDRWLTKQIININGEAVNLEKAMSDDWDLADLQRAVRMLADISG